MKGLQTLCSTGLILNNNKSTAVQMDIEFIFKSFFELPNIFQACIDYTAELQDNNQLTNIIQGQSWLERKRGFSSKIVIPFCLYHDDFEPGNTLGSKSGIQSLSSFFVHTAGTHCHITGKHPPVAMLKKKIWPGKNLASYTQIFKIIGSNWSFIKYKW